MDCNDYADAVRAADVVHGRLVELGRTVAVAESLTGGLIGALLTAAPATSVTFRGGLIVYSSDLKHSLAGVDDVALARYGPVHPAIAAQLAAGARERLTADYGIGITGVAGPAEQAGHGVGEVFVAIADDHETAHARYNFDGGREHVRRAAATAALIFLLSVLDQAIAATSR